MTMHAGGSPAGAWIRGRPRSITCIGWLFIVVGAIGVGRQLLPFVTGMAWPGPVIDAWYAAASGAVALVGGAFLLRGRGWARWVLAAWLAFHVYLSLLHGTTELVIHSALFVVIVFLLIRPAASAWLAGAAPRP